MKYKEIQITISRYTGCGKIERKNWKDLISSLCLAGYEVYAQLGYGFLEKSYQNALILELKWQNFYMIHNNSITCFNLNYYGFIN